MTMLSPLGRVPRRRPSMRRRTHRPVPALVLLVALSVVAAVVWWRVLHRGTGESIAAAGPARSGPAAVLCLDPRRVKVRVYNATERLGLARTVADQLRRRGFSIAATSNDPLAEVRNVRGVGELRYGAPGAAQAKLVSWQFPGIRLAEDPRTDAVVDVAVGPSFRRLATAAQVGQAKQRDVAKGVQQRSRC